MCSIKTCNVENNKVTLTLGCLIKSQKKVWFFGQFLRLSSGSADLIWIETRQFCCFDYSRNLWRHFPPKDRDAGSRRNIKEIFKKVFFTFVRQLSVIVIAFFKFWTKKGRWWSCHGLKIILVAFGTVKQKNQNSTPISRLSVKTESLFVPISSFWRKTFRKWSNW